MIRAFSAALEDDNLLVRRGALDLLLQSMRVDSVAVQRARAEDRAILMRAATGVVLRRDLSLNRRLYTWLLGPDDKSDHQIEYLKKHALELLKDTLKVSVIRNANRRARYGVADYQYVGRDVYAVGGLSGVTAFQDFHLATR